MKRIRIRLLVLAVTVLMMNVINLSWCGAVAETNGKMILRLKSSVDMETRELSVESQSFLSLGVDTKGSGLKYQWQYQPAGGEWTDWKGRTASSLYELAGEEMDGWLIRCTVTDGTEVMISESVMLTVTPAILSCRYSASGGQKLASTSYNEPIACVEGSTVTVTLECSRDGLAYQWYLADNWYQDTGTKLKGQTDYKLDIKPDKSMDGKYLNCVITNGQGWAQSLLDHYVLQLRVIPMSISSQTIYVLSSYDQSYISIPADLPQKIDVRGKTCEWVSGRSAELKDGWIVPISYTISGTSEYDYDYNETVFLVDGTETLKVTLENYAVRYAQETIGTYLAEKITAGMTERQKAELCCEFVCSYDYSPYAQSYTGMILYGGGDCWASTNTLMYMFEKLGIEAEVHDSRDIMGGMEEHYNVAAYLDGIYCIVEAGYGGAAPRYWSIEEFTARFAYRVLADGSSIAITALLNTSRNTDIAVPEIIDGYTVTGLDKGSLRSHPEVTSITLPQTLTEIAEGDVFGGTGITTITIPASVTSLSADNFMTCLSLERIEVAEGNSHYRSVDGMLLTADGKKLLLCPREHQGDLIIPATVETIGEKALFFVTADTLSLPASLKTVEERAFDHMTVRKVVVPEGVVTLPDYLFSYMSIKTVSLPDSLKHIGDGAFAGCYLHSVVLPGQLVSIGASAFENVHAIGRIYIPASVRTIGNKAFAFFMMGTDPALVVFDPANSSTAFGEDVFRDAVIAAAPGSDADQYATQNSIAFIPLNESGRILIDRTWFTETVNDQYYTGEAIHPAFAAITGKLPFALKENRDYRVIWGENIKPGEGTITVRGRGIFCGSLTVSFNIISNGSEDPDDSLPASGGATLMLDADSNTATVTGIVEGSTRVTIPAVYQDENGNRYKVTAIAPNAFRNIKKLTKVCIGKNVEKIGKNAFYGCVKLNTVSGMSGVKTIGEGAFQKCTSLAGFTICKKVTKIGKATFKGCKALTEIKGCTKVKAIGKDAFNGCLKLKTIPAFTKLEAIGDTAFKGCKALTKLTLSANVKKIGKEAYSGCAALKTITIKTTKLTSKNVGANAFKGISKKAKTTCPKSKLKSYKKFLPKRGIPANGMK